MAATRKDALITHIGTFAKEIICEQCASVHPARNQRDYRQKAADFFSLSHGRIESGLLDADIFKEEYGYLLLKDRLLKDRLLKNRPLKEYLRNLNEGDIVGIFPLEKAAMYTHLSGALRYLFEKIGPVQIEGCFTHRRSTKLYLYQLLRVPELPVDHHAVNISDPILSSTRVIGRSDFTGPLMRISERMLSGLDAAAQLEGSPLPFVGIRSEVRREVQIIRDFDKRHRRNGYALLAPNHSRALVALTPNCRCRLSALWENPSNHSVTMMRFQIDAEPHAGHHIAWKVEGPLVDRQVTNNDFEIIPKVHLVSNGREMAVERVKRTFREWLFG